MTVSPTRPPTSPNGAVPTSDTPPGSGTLTSAPPSPSRKGRVPDSIRRREYVSSGSGIWSTSQGRSLPIAPDDLSEQYGIGVYDEMMLDAQVAGCVTVLKTSIIEDGITLAPLLNDQSDPKYQQSVKIKEDAERMFRLLDTPFDDVLWAMLDALVYGNKVAELVSVLETEPDGRSTLRIRSIKPKPQESIAFVCDAYLNVLGLIGASAGRQSPQAQGQLLDPNSPLILPRDKFAVLSWRPVDSDPRGTSMLRPAWEPWWRKRQLGPEYLRYLSQFASPSVWATPPDGVTMQPATDGLGNLLDADGQPIDPDDPDAASKLAQQMTPQELLLAALLAWRNGYALAVPFGTQVNTVEAQGDGRAFLRAFALCDIQIHKAILCQDMSTEAGEPPPRVQTGERADILDTIVRQGKRAVVKMVTDDILRPWVERNYPKEDLELVPIVSLGTTERKDQAALMTSVAALMRAAYFHPSQLRAVDELLGLPIRDLTQPPQPQPEPAPAPGEPSVLPGGEQGTGGLKPAPQSPQNPSGPSGPAQRGGAPPNKTPPAKAGAPTAAELREDAYVPA